jgi:ABC-type lipoprotein release transport system permease subunit
MQCSGALVHCDADAAEHPGPMDGAVTAVRFRADDVMAAPATRGAASAGSVLDDAVDNQRLDRSRTSSYFRAIRLEKMMMSLILSLIIGVAAFNIVASLVMVVTDKTTDIAVLRTLGMGPNGVVRVFFVQGALIGWAGVIVRRDCWASCWRSTCRWSPPFLEQSVSASRSCRATCTTCREFPPTLQWQDVAVIAVGAFASDVARDACIRRAVPRWSIRRRRCGTSRAMSVVVSYATWIGRSLCALAQSPTASCR